MVVKAKLVKEKIHHKQGYRENQKIKLCTLSRDLYEDYPVMKSVPNLHW